MKAMILGAGRGNRLRPLTDHTPKPLLSVNGKPLIIHQIEAIKKAGIKEFIINIAHLKEKFYEILGDGAQFGVKITYSLESTGALETGGGIINALPLLGSEPFLVVSGDLFTDFPFEQLPRQIEKLAHIVLTDNPSHHPEGDFCLNKNEVHLGKENRLNFAGIGVYHPALFKSYKPGFYPLGLILKDAAKQNLVTGEYYLGKWINIGSPEQLKSL